MLYFIQLIHSIIAIINFSCLFYMIWAHWNNVNNILLKICYVAIAIEVVSILTFGFSCPIDVFVKYYWSPQTKSILFPDYIAKWFIEFGAALFLVAITIKVLQPIGKMGVEKNKNE